MKKKEKNRNRKKISNGFTLIELLLSLAIITILTGASLSIARFSETQKNLTLSANQLRALIRSAQTYALAIPIPSDRHICGFGVYFDGANTAQLFLTEASETDFRANANVCSTASYLKADTIYRTNLTEADRIVLKASSNLTGTANDIFFRAPYGKVYTNGVAGGKTYTLSSGGGTKDVIINSVGKIE